MGKPPSSAEKMSRYCKKKKDNVNFKQPESKRQEKCRKARIQKMNETEKEENKIKAQEKKRKTRAAKKAAAEQNSSSCSNERAEYLCHY